MWLVMNIGCIECGVSSAVVGVFSDKAKAEAIAAECDKKYDWREGGQNAFEVFELPETEKIAPEYEVGFSASLTGAAGALSAASGLTDVLEDTRLRYCSFCGGGEHEREYLIAACGPVYICEQCVEICRDVIGAAREAKRTAEQQGVSANAALRPRAEGESGLESTVMQQEEP